MKAVKDLDLDARPSLEEVLALRADRTRTVDRVMTLLTDDELDDERRCGGPGHPKAGLWSVRRCAAAVVNEEWRHRDYAERDLARLVPPSR
jgi:DinB superfamily